MRDWVATLWQLVRLWPEALLGVVTIWMVADDGLRTSPGDPSYYYKIAEQVSQGMIPYRDFPFEYPPVSLPPVLLPYFLPGGTPSLETYLRFLFTDNVLMVLAIGAGVAWLAWRGWSLVSLPRGGVMYGLLALSLAPVVVWRYDALPTLLTVLAVIAVAHHRPVASGVALGAAVVGKLYPLAMLPALFIGQIRNRRLTPAFLLALACVATVGLIMAPFVFVAGSSAFSFVDYATARAVQIESGPGALALLANVMGGPDASIYHGFGTWQVDSPLIPILGPLWTLLTVVLIAALGLGIWHRYRVDRIATGGLRPTSHITHLLAALMVVLVSSKVLSPQYLFWAVPFVALESRPKTLVFWVACLLTTFVYPLNYQEFMNQEMYAVVVVNVRNAILVAFTFWVIAPDLRSAVIDLRDWVTKRGTGPRPDPASA